MAWKKPDKPPVELTFFYHGDTDKAWRLSETGIEGGGFWMPKSQVDLAYVGKLEDGKAVVATVPEWLAKSKGLI